MEDSLRQILKPYPKFKLQENDVSRFSRLRALEPQLVSSLHEAENDALQILGWYHQAIPLGAASFYCLVNPQRKQQANRYARVDLIITEPAMRGPGVGCLLVACTILQLIDQYHGQIYSVSCLAAHVAIEKILESIGFHGTKNPNLNYTHEEYSLNSQAEQAVLRAKIHKLATECAQRVNYRLIQRSPDTAVRCCELSGTYLYVRLRQKHPTLTRSTRKPPSPGRIAQSSRAGFRRQGCRRQQR